MIEAYCRCPGCGECDAHEELTHLRAENTRLRAEVKALRKALERVYFFQPTIPLQTKTPAEQMREIAKAALAAGRE